MKEQVRELLLSAGAIAVGFAKAGEIDKISHENYADWIRKGFHGEMEYLERHLSLRNHTDNLLPGAKTVISLAFSFSQKEMFGENKPYIATYAYGEDYHISLRELLTPILDDIKCTFGGEWRICIDSAPLAERYWALKSGIGKRGLNGMVIINGDVFSFLVEILTTLEITPDESSENYCERCGACIKNCPTRALNGDGTMNACLCLNYLTIEKKGEFNETEINLLNKDSGCLFGCDKCLRVCPHQPGNKEKTISCFSMSQEMKEISTDSILKMDSKEFKKKFQRSPLLYAGFKRLVRNAKALKTKSAGNR